MKSARILNGYRVVFQPEHPTSMKTKNWEGYVYEHIYLVEMELGRPLSREEVVHHLDGDRGNNKLQNLLVILRRMHTRLHSWISRGVLDAPKKESSNQFCSVCEATLQESQESFCSNECRGIGRRLLVRPSKEQLAADLAVMPMTTVGKKYGVSDNAVRKWAKSYLLQTKRV